MILDINGDPVSSFSFQMESSDVVTFKIRIICLAEYHLRSEITPDVTIEGKLEADVSYTDLTTGGILLTPYANTYQTFDIRLTAASVIDQVFEAFKIYLG
jgi:hypothetical protein